MKEPKGLISDESVELKPATSKKTDNIFDAVKNDIVKTIDQNEDGIFDTKDVGVIVNNVGKFINSTIRDIDLKTLKPVFKDDIISSAFTMPELIRLTNMDKRHSASEACKDSIAHMSVYNDIEMINIYRNHINDFSIEFYPDMKSEVYFADPCKKNLYIALDRYFEYLNNAKVNELQIIAQNLGATFVRVSYKNAKKSLKTKKVVVKEQVNRAINTSGDGEYSFLSKGSANIDIAAEMNYLGHEPVEPNIIYLKNDTNVQSLIIGRMNHNTMTNIRFSIKCSNSSGISLNVARKIDILLRAVKCSLKINLAEEVQNEEKKELEYEIRF